MKRSILADTGPLYAAADPDDQYHERAQKELKRLNRDRRPVVVAYPILLESYTLVLYRLGKEAASKWLGETMAGASLVNPAAEDYRAATAKLLQGSARHLARCDGRDTSPAHRLFGVDLRSSFRCDARAGMALTIGYRQRCRPEHFILHNLLIPGVDRSNVSKAIAVPHATGADELEHASPRRKL
jgi:hypothetical protein